MSIEANNNFITSFDGMVKQAYQAQMMLRPAVRLKTGVVGSTHKFPKMGSGIATERIRQSDVSPMNITHSDATATLKDYNAAEYSDVFDINKLAFDERRELALAVAGAIGRRSDQIVLDALAAGANSTEVGTDVGGSGTGLNLEKILRAKRLMDDANVPNDGRRHFACSAQAIEQALLVDKISSNDYNTLKALVTGELKQFAGFTFHMLGTRSEGGLSVASNIRTNFAFHQDAVGLAIGMDMRSEVNYVPEKTSYLVNGLFSAGAVGIDDSGIYAVKTTES